MTIDRHAELFEYIAKAYDLLDQGDVVQAVELTLFIEKLSKDMVPDDQPLGLRAVASCLVDIGYAAQNEAMILRGTSYFRTWLFNYASEQGIASELFNYANGYFSSWKLHKEEFFTQSTDSNEHRVARSLYRLALHNLASSDYTDGTASTVWTSYGNALDESGRSVEAIDAYDTAIRIDPNCGMAFGNKAIVVESLAYAMQGYTHWFYLEAVRLYTHALKSEKLTPEAHANFTIRLHGLHELIDKHGTMEPETLKIVKPTSKFHLFMCDFYATNGLYLNPATFIGENHQPFYGDPMFISTMHADVDNLSKFDRYITFLNEIKQDFSLGRFFLAQSQYPSKDIDRIDEGVSLFYPLDYSWQSSYVQLLKAANKQAIAVLDKIAFFIYDYCKLKTPESDRVTFRRLWGGNEKLRGELSLFSNKHLLALFAMAHDVSKNGNWSRMYDYRDALTHRFLMLHSMQLDTQENSDIPRENLEIFLTETIHALKIARAAVMYLILFVEANEQKEAQKYPGIKAPILSVPYDNIFRYRPSKPHY